MRSRTPMSIRPRWERSSKSYTPASPPTRKLEAISQINNFRAITGMPRFGHALALAKVLRWKQINPQLLEQTRKLCYLSDLLTLWMTGRHVTEGGVAGISGAMNVTAFDWSNE